MGRIVQCMMATSFVVLLMISTNSPSCQACLWPWCKPRPKAPCFETTNKDHCTMDICARLCEANGVVSKRPICIQKFRAPRWQCCCPKSP
ncbi:hypothetical protein SETIT_8G224300v2 [Setaria italica]|uniref:Bowman-Birk serine protease inhibitors family domain-containing protein n=1 Tax=Setaria italica TaxID=4555 RepID=K3ZKJ7_SETIT|nr:hypothetical protein SETIT_8G224300v2 [Setaria italica]